MQNKRIIIISTLLAGMLVFSSCKDNPASFEDDPPELPPQSSMEMDFSTFENQGGQLKMGTEAVVQDTMDNFNQAVARAFIMKVVVELNLAIPRALLTAAQNADAELNDEGEWVWSYSNSVDNESYEVRLVAAREGEDQVHWSLYVTNTSLELDNRIFFEGTTSGDGTSGSWTYYDLFAPDPLQEASQISWQVEGEENVQLRLDVLTDRNEHQGDYIEYDYDGTIKHAVYYNAGDDTTVEIQWNVDTHEGYLIAPEYNGGQQACWNSDLVNITCG